MASNKSKKNQKLLETIALIIVLVVGGFFGVDYLSEDKGDDQDAYEQLPLEEYYQGAEGLSGDELKDFLNNLVSTGVKDVDYGDAKVYLAEADADPDDPTKLLTIYSRDKVNATWDGGDTWAREHVWPNSRLGMERVGESDVCQASDLHNLRAIVPSVNSSRSNKSYDTVTGAETWYPGDEDKGDVARILFYMVIRYSYLNLVDDNLADDPDTNYTMDGARMGKLSVLIKWHHEDPVDDFERQRNEVIYKYQNNRNPFIDHPEFAQYIFEGQAPVSFNHFENPVIVMISDVKLKEKYEEYC
jgi:endonuclease I